MVEKLKGAWKVITPALRWLRDYGAAVAAVVICLAVARYWGTAVEFKNYLAAGLGHGIAGALVMAGGLGLLNRMTPRLDFQYELQQKNMPLAVVIVGFMMAIAFLMRG